MGGDAQDAFEGSDIALHTTSKSVATVCGATDFKQMCVDRMNNVHSKNESASTKDYLKAAIRAILDEVELFLNKSGSIFGDKVSNPMVKMAEGSNWRAPSFVFNGGG